ncbi:MAG: hypothetical protein QOG33_21 [Gaiellales bacterium]|jgi:hypothetical protein|nr:hypothetical protein [Gaiellales bacterium]
MLAAGAVIVTVVVLASTASNNGTGRHQPHGPVIPASTGVRDVPLTAAARRGINRTLDAFIPAAVLRDDPERGYSLTTASFHGGATRAGWASGAVPVMPYPAAGHHWHGWRMTFSNPGLVGLDLELRPTDPSKVGLVAFSVVMKRVHGRWLIDAFAPVAGFQPTGSGANIQAEPDFSPAAKGSGAGDRHLGSNWILLPLGVIAAPLLALIVLALVALVRSRRRRPAATEPLDEYYSAMGRSGDRP